MPKRSSDDFDNDHTDELPVLLETVVLGDDREPLFGREDTSEHTALYQAAEQPAAGISALHAELAEHATQAADLENELATLAERVRDLEQRLVGKDQLIGELKHTVATLRESADDASAAERRLATQLAVRDARIAEAATTIEQLQREVAARAAELDGLRAAADAARRETDAVRNELAARPVPSAPTQSVQGLLEDNAALRDYIAGRQAWWNELQEKQAGLSTRITTLEQELVEGKKALAAAEAFAERESSRAVALRAELVDYSRRAAELERELRIGRVDADEPGAVAPAPTVAVAPEPLSPSPATTDVQAPTPAPVEEPPAAPDVDAIAQLEAEVGYKRQQVAAQLVELRERDKRLHTAAADLDKVRRELTALHNELDESRATVARLERAVIDKDRALQARDARIATLHDELKQRIGAIEKLNAIDFSQPRAESPPTNRAATIDAGDKGSAPALLCLTGDAPKRFALTKKTLTVGRAPQCDLQILTHFVSREHARLTIVNGTVLIEDLGSRNGVYVNAVRVDRHTLRQGDLVTIGETQFRFTESMAH
jgi:predicted  nucleic acid-binding Zn-ribbon protein